MVDIEQDWQSTANWLWALCRKHLHGHQEPMAYGTPTCTTSGQSEVAFAKRLTYLSHYFMKLKVLVAHRS